MAFVGISLQRFQASTPTGKCAAARNMRLLKGVTSMTADLYSVCFDLNATQNDCKCEPCLVLMSTVKMPVHASWTYCL
jgi:hypothetical protein